MDAWLSQHVGEPVSQRNSAQSRLAWWCILMITKWPHTPPQKNTPKPPFPIPFTLKCVHIFSNGFGFFPFWSRIMTSIVIQICSFNLSKIKLRYLKFSECLWIFLCVFVFSLIGKKRSQGCTGRIAQLATLLQFQHLAVRFCSFSLGPSAASGMRNGHRQS